MSDLTGMSTAETVRFEDGHVERGTDPLSPDEMENLSQYLRDDVPDLWQHGNRLMSERLQATARRLRALTTWHPMTEKPKKPGLYLLAVEHIDGEIGVREARFFGITWQYGNLKQHGWREKPDYEPTEGG